MIDDFSKSPKHINHFGLFNLCCPEFHHSVRTGNILVGGKNTGVGTWRSSEDRGGERDYTGDLHVRWCGCGMQKFGLLGLVGPSDGEEKG